MKVGFITTIDTNIGDDFIRQGIINALEYTFPEIKFEYILVNKHVPYTAYPKTQLMRYWETVNNANYPEIIKKGYRFLTRIVKSKSVYEDCDIIIQSGAPVLWENCSTNEWNYPIWQQIIGKLYKTKTVLNLAAGSCYPMERIPATIDNIEDAKYLKSIYSYCKLTTTRDPLAEKLLSSLNCSPSPMLPCSAFLVSREYPTETGKYIMINYMEGGGHFDWGQNINKEEWEKTILAVIENYKNEHPIAFLCHNQMEYDLAEKLMPGVTKFFPKTVDEYLATVKQAKAAINNRMHASVAMGSIGIPSIAVCTDTRLLMVKNIGLPVYYVKEATREKLIQDLDNFLNNKAAIKSQLFDLKKDTFEKYAILLNEFFRPV